MITLDDYVGPHSKSPDWTDDRRKNAIKLLIAVAELEAYMALDGVIFPRNPATGTSVSGQRYGGFRPKSCAIGAERSAHKEGLAVDIFDPVNEIDTWLMANQDKLALCGAYIEHPDATNKWAHISILAPKSGKRIFYP